MKGWPECELPTLWQPSGRQKSYPDYSNRFPHGGEYGVLHVRLQIVLYCRQGYLGISRIPPFRGGEGRGEDEPLFSLNNYDLVNGSLDFLEEIVEGVGFAHA